MASSDDEIMKQPIKRLEIPINKFNDVAIPHHLDLLNKHKSNITKYQAVSNWNKVYTEQINASRIVKQLKQLLHEMDTLRGQVQDTDITAFDKLTTQSRSNILSAIENYLELELNLPAAQKSSGRIEVISTEAPNNQQHMQIQAEQEDVERQEACLSAWTTLQDDLHQLQQLFVDFNKIVHEQKELVNRAEDNIEEAQTNIEYGTKSLQQAAKYKVMTYPLAGALLGSCIGGPVGLLAGLKFGGLTAIGGGILGFTGAKILKENILNPELKQIEAAPTEITAVQELNEPEDKKNS